MPDFDASLPINDSLDAITAGLRDDGRIIIAAPPGAGKTTCVPPAILRAFPTSGRILLLQPRRMAARSVAMRLAANLGAELGGRVGYQVRMDRRWGPESQIVVMTYGVLLRRLQSDPLLESFGTVLLDEFHERSLEADLALGMLVRVRSLLREDLRFAVMSATMDIGPIASFLDGAPVVESVGRTYPLQIEYASRIRKDRIEDQVADIVPEALRRSTGHVLVFLPGVGEIRRTARRIAQLSAVRGLEVAELYGDQTPQQQDAVLRSSTQRKIILATNVAETSITIPGVGCVIDSGLARIARMNPSVGLPRLDLEPISQASANQRAGRAGRTGPGICFRLWMKAADRARPEFDLPEILRGDLAGAVLQLLGWGENDIAAFPWLSPPRAEAIEAAMLLLQRLGAVADGRATELGRRMLAIPAHPRMARMMVEAARRGVVRRAAICAAMLSERDPFIDTGGGARLSRGDTALMGLDSTDIVSRAGRMERWIEGAEDEAILKGPGRAVHRAADQLADSLRDKRGFDGGDDAMEPADNPIENAPETPRDEAEIDAALAQTLLAAFPDRLAKLRQPASDRGIMVGGQGVRFRRAKTSGAELYLCIDLLQKTTDAEVRLSTPIEPEWLDTGMQRDVDECFFHPSQRKVVGRRRVYWLDLLLSEIPTSVTDDSQAKPILLSEVRARWDRVFPADDPAIKQLLARIACHRQVIEDSEFPEIGQPWLTELASEICEGRRGLDEVRQAPWIDLIRGRLGYDRLSQLDRLAPQSVQVPSGTDVAIDYSQSSQPSLSVRLQELFGWTETPRILGGRLPLLLRIQAPNYREIQVTSDLASFWRGAYFEIRKELRRRYPKHQWPEDPLTATATRSGLARSAPKKK
jgi:ATP-dependent helicase HrpB